jgi:hypothetical protein
MKARISKLVMSAPGVVDALRALGTAGARDGLPKETTQRVQLRANSHCLRAVMIRSHGRGGTGLRGTAHQSRRKL